MEKSEISEIIQELIDSPEIFKQSIEVYKKLPDDHPNKKKLGTAIKNAKEALEKSFTSELINKLNLKL